MERTVEDAGPYTRSQMSTAFCTHRKKTGTCLRCNPLVLTESLPSAGAPPSPNILHIIRRCLIYIVIQPV